jgi:hypothetical protein
MEDIMSIPQSAAINWITVFSLAVALLSVIKLVLILREMPEPYSNAPIRTKPKPQPEKSKTKHASVMKLLLLFCPDGTDHNRQWHLRQLGWELKPVGSMYHRSYRHQKKNIIIAFYKKEVDVCIELEGKEYCVFDTEKGYMEEGTWIEAIIPDLQMAIHNDKMQCIAEEEAAAAEADRIKKLIRSQTYDDFSCQDAEQLDP